MKVIPPLTGASPSITEAMLTSTTVAESETQWLVGTNYAMDAMVRGPAGAYVHRLFKSIQPNNQAHAVNDTEWWEDIGPSNRWAMFDLLRNTGTTGASPMVVEVTPGARFDAVGLAGLIADSVLIEIIVAGITKYSQTVSLITRRTTGWYSYFFGSFMQKGEHANLALPPYSGAKIKLTFARAAGNVTVGACLIGSGVYLGEVEPQAEDDTQNYSRIERDDFGNIELIPRRGVPRTKQTTNVDSAYVPSIRDVRELLNAVPAMWVGLERYPSHDYFPSLLILGIYISFKINLTDETLARIDIDLEET